MRGNDGAPSLILADGDSGAPAYERQEMSYLDLVCRVTLFRALHAVDCELAERQREQRCPVEGCGGPLHWATYERHPRGEGVDEIPKEHRCRLGLCCGWCRTRVLPPSCLFFGRRVYWGCVVLLVAAAAQGLESHTIADLCRRFEVSRRTVKRWVSFFEVIFPGSQQWQRLRGRVGVQVRDDDLPRGLLAWFFETASQAEDGLVACLKALAKASLATQAEG